MISLFPNAKPATLADGEPVEVIGVTKADDGASLWVVRRVVDTGESTMRCYSFVTLTGEDPIAGQLAKAA